MSKHKSEDYLKNNTKTYLIVWSVIALFTLGVVSLNVRVSLAHSKE